MCIRDSSSASAACYRPDHLIKCPQEMNPLDNFSFIQLLWGVPILLAIHNLEEAPFMEKWSKELPLPIHPIVSTKQFVAAVSLLTIAGFAATYFGINSSNQPIGISIILGIQMVMLINVFVPHLATAIRFRKYSPGIITGLLLNLSLIHI